MYIGLDIGSRLADFAITSDGEHFTQGKLNLADFPALVAKHQIKFMACEYTGRLAEQWCLAAKEAGIKAYILHSVERRALTKLTRQSIKTDQRDAEALASLVYLWADKSRRQMLRLSGDLMTDAETVRTAWQLRSMLASVEALTKVRTAAKLRVITAGRVGNLHMAAIWQEHAKSDAPERALASAREFAQAEFPNELRLLETIPGIGPVASVSLCAALLPIERFEQTKTIKGKARDITLPNLKRYAGLYPKVESSGNMTKAEFLSRRGNPRLRGLLHICAMSASQGSNPLSRYYRKRVDKDGMPPKKALVLCSCKLLNYALSVLRSGQPFVDKAAPQVETRPDLPGHLITQAEAAGRLGVSRQRVGQLVKSGNLRAQVWPEQKPQSRPEQKPQSRKDHAQKVYVVLKYLDLMIDQRRAQAADKAAVKANVTNGALPFAADLDQQETQP